MGGWVGRSVGRSVGWVGLVGWLVGQWLAEINIPIDLRWLVGQWLVGWLVGLHVQLVGW